MTGSPPPFTITILAFATGVLVCGLLQGHAIPTGLLFIATVAAATAAIARPVLLLVTVFFAGALWFALAADSVRGGRVSGGGAVVTGTVVDFPRQGEFGVRFLFQPVGGGLRLSVGDYTAERPVYRSGETWRLHLRLRPPHGRRNAGGFDRERWMFLRRVGGSGVVIADPGNRLLRPAPVWNIVPRWRGEVLAAVRSTLADSPHIALIEALAVGVQSSLAAAQWEVLRASGTAHLVAISGLHIGLVAGLGFVLAHGLWWLAVVIAPARLRPRRRWNFALPVALLLALFYAALAGFSLPTQRALVMLLALTATRLIHRRAGLFHGLAVALLAVLLLDPLPVLTAGFWLSFAAVAVIGLVLVNMPPPPPKPSKELAKMPTRLWRQLWLPVAVAVRVQVGLGLALVPMLVLFFGKAPLVAPLVNLVVVPWVGVAVVPAVVAAAAATVAAMPTLAAVLLAVAERAMAVAWAPMAWAAAVPLQVALPMPSAGAMAAAAVGVALLLAARKLPGRWLAPVFLAPLLLGAPASPPAGVVRATVLDTGQGLAVLVRTRRHALLYDAGPAYRSGYDAGVRVVTPSLRAVGIGRLDALVLSHGDRDHAGGADAVIAAFRPGRVLSGEPERFTDVDACADGDTWTWDGVTFTVLTDADAAADANNASCVLRVAGVGGALLLTGDIERAAEESLLARHRPALPAAAIVVPHHGSGTSSHAAFVAAVGAGVAVVSADKYNTHGHPHPAVVERYRAAGGTVWSTGEAGAVTVDIGVDGTVSVSGIRQRRPGLWQR